MHAINPLPNRRPAVQGAGVSEQAGGVPNQQQQPPGYGYEGSPSRAGAQGGGGAQGSGQSVHVPVQQVPHVPPAPQQQVSPPQQQQLHAAPGQVPGQQLPHQVHGGAVQQQQQQAGPGAGGYVTPMQTPQLTGAGSQMGGMGSMNQMGMGGGGAYAGNPGYAQNPMYQKSMAPQVILSLCVKILGTHP